jgi:hypothetical protein
MLWLGKAIVQLGLSKVPFGEAVNHKLQLMGGKRSDAYFGMRLDWGLKFLERMQRNHVNFSGKQVLEIGTGWDAIHTILLYSVGVQNITSVDVIPHARIELSQKIVTMLREQTSRVAAISGELESVITERLDRLAATGSVAELFEAMNARYLAPGDASKTGLAENSVDMVYSYAVYSHIPSDVLTRIVNEERRIIRPGGQSVHRIVMEDPFAAENGGDGVNFLRFSEKIWRLIGENNIRYHNRLRASEVVALYSGHKSVVEHSNPMVLPENLQNLKKIKLNERFVGMTPEDLAATGLDLVVRHN